MSVRNVDVGTLARYLDVTTQRIAQLSKEPGFPDKIARGEYDLDLVAQWYIRHIKAELKRRGPTGTVVGSNMHAEKLRLVAAQAIKIETENRVRRGDLLTVDAVREVWQQRVSNTQKRLRAIPTTLGPQLTNKSQPAYIADRMKAAIDEACTELAGDDFGEESGSARVPSGGEPIGRDGVETVCAPTELHGEPVGGREATAIE